METMKKETDDQEILISVIIPHYNSVKTLLKAAASAKVNNCVEVIVVDDKSDLSPEEFEKLETYFAGRGVTFLHNATDKKGAGVCRNIGLDHARGEWLLFVDSDDYLRRGWYETVLPCTSADADIVYFPPTSRNLSTGGASTRHVMYKELVEQYLKNGSSKNETELKYGFCTPWSKLFRRSLPVKHQIRFDETIVSNDIMFVTKCAYYAEKISADPHVIYCVTRMGATLTSKKSEENFWVRIDVLADRYQFLKQNLTAQEFKNTHIGQYVFGQAAVVIENGWGMAGLKKLLRVYRENGMKMTKAGLWDLRSFLRKAKMLLLWFSDIRKSKS